MRRLIQWLFGNESPKVLGGRIFETHASYSIGRCPEVPDKVSLLVQTRFSVISSFLATSEVREMAKALYEAARDCDELTPFEEKEDDSDD